MQQKAQIIATFLHDPDLVVIDEPFSGLDPVNTRLIKEVISEQRHAGKTVIMSTHQMHQVEALCNRILLISDGEAVLYGPVREIKQRYAGNAVLVRGRADFYHLPGVVEAWREGDDWHLALAHDGSPKDVLRALAEQKDAEIEHFEVAEPSLEDIFVRVVQAGEHLEPEVAGA
jgi:ABC-2 type transport system ATP-binding protein